MFLLYYYDDIGVRDKVGDDTFSSLETVESREHLISLLDKKLEAMREHFCLATEAAKEFANFVLGHIEELRKILEKESEIKNSTPQGEVLDTDEDLNSRKSGEEEDYKEPQLKKTKYDEVSTTGYEGCPQGDMTSVQ